MTMSAADARMADEGAGRLGKDSAPGADPAGLTKFTELMADGMSRGLQRHRGEFERHHDLSCAPCHPAADIDGCE